MVQTLHLATRAGVVEVEFYRPRSRGSYPGVVTSFGVNPTGAMDPRVPQMGDALARAGFAVLLYWPPTARDMSIEPGDVEELVSAYLALLQQPSVDSARSGLVGIANPDPDLWGMEIVAPSTSIPAGRRWSRAA